PINVALDDIGLAVGYTRDEHAEAAELGVPIESLLAVGGGCLQPFNRAGCELHLCHVYLRLTAALTNISTKPFFDNWPRSYRPGHSRNNCKSQHPPIAPIHLPQILAVLFSQPMLGVDVFPLVGNSHLQIKPRESHALALKLFPVLRRNRHL